MSRKEPELECLDRQLRDAFQRADLPVAPTRLRADVESLASSTRSFAGQTAPRRLGLVPRRTAVAALLTAAAVIAVVAVGLPVFLTQPQAGHPSPSDSRPTEVATSSPSSTPSATPSPNPSPEPVLTAADGSSITADGPSIAWTSFPLGQFGSNRVWAVGAAQVGTTTVVAANDSTQNDMKPVLIESRDGTNWTRVPTDVAAFASARLDYLLRIPGGLLLVGESTLRDPLCAGGALGCNPVSAVLMWQSSDGQTWQSLPPSALAPFNRLQIVSMTAGARGLVAYSEHWTVEGSTPTFIVLHSTDGTSWASSVFPDQNGGKTGVLVQEVAATPNGFVAIGSNDQVSGSAATVGGAAWYSPDGLTWTRAAAPAGSNDLILYAAAGSAGIVATTNAIVPSSNQVWVSADGKTWRMAKTSPFIGGSGWLAGDGNQILAISGPSVTWSNDGLTWHRGNSTPPMPSMSTPGMSGLAWILGSTVVTVGPDGTTLFVGQVTGH
jgi:hypothetical protein